MKKSKSQNKFYLEPEFLRGVRDAQKFLREVTGKTGFFDPLGLLTPDAIYYVVFGERSNGKTFGAQLCALVRFFLFGDLFAVVRRWDEDFRPKAAARFFGGAEKTGLIKYLSAGNYDHIVCKSKMFYLAEWSDDGREIVCKQPCGYGFALTQMEHDKGGTYPNNISTIIFDEFLTRSIYVPDEFVLFQNVISTIMRDDGQAVCWMLGNTVSTYCPYFREMGMKHIRDMKIGDIDYYTDGDEKTLIVCHYADGAGGSKTTNRYFAFDNPKLQMITAGAFETAIYPHCPADRRRNEIVFRFFIVFDGETLSADVIRDDAGLWIFVQPKTTPLKYPDDDLIYSDQYDRRRNWRRRINRPETQIEKIIYSLFRAEKIFYSDNQTGETVRTYLQWCVTDRGAV